MIKESKYRAAMERLTPGRKVHFRLDLRPEFVTRLRVVAYYAPTRYFSPDWGPRSLRVINCVSNSVVWSGMAPDTAEELSRIVVGKIRDEIVRMVLTQ